VKQPSLTWAASRLRPAITGGERYDLEVVEHWKRCGIAVHELEIDKLPRHDHLTSSLALRRHLLATGDRLAFLDFGPHNQYLLGALWHKMRGGKLATLVHHLSYPQKTSALHQKLDKALCKLFLSKCDLIVVNSKDTMHAVMELDVPSNLIGLAYPTLGIFPPASLPPPRIPQKPYRLLYVGYFKRRKGFDLLLDVLVNLPVGSFTLTAVGDETVDAAYAAEMHMRVKALGIPVEFKGRLDVEEMSRLFLEHDLLVHPARHEGFGMTLVEAQAHGLPVVAWATGGITEVLTDRAGGIQIVPFDIAAFTRAVQELLSDAKLWLSQRESAIARGKSMGGWDKPSAGILDLLRQHHLL
jgi:glycosyltransferase involved in cell wall biosynthesis